MGPIRPIALIGLIALIGCSVDNGGEDTPLPTEQLVPIALGGAMQDEQQVTRSGDGIPLKDKTTTFTVYGFKDTGAETYQQVFPGYRVLWTENSVATTSTNSDGWEYVGQQLPGSQEQTVKFWDYGATAYRFMGVTGTGVTGAYGSGDQAGSYLLTFNADSDDEDATPYYSHLWYREISSEDIGKAVQLEFLKPFCKVRFMFTFENPADTATTTLTDKSFHPTNGTTIKTEGDITVSYPLTGATTETLIVSEDAGGIVGFEQDYYERVTWNDEVTPTHVVSPYYDADHAATALSKWYTVLPATGQGTYTLEVGVNGDPKTAVVPAEFMEWLPGYSYTYVFKLHVDGGVSIGAVQSAFTSWVEGNEGSHPVYNW